jgi:hypothetical protein
MFIDEANNASGRRVANLTSVLKNEHTLAEKSFLL